MIEQVPPAESPAMASDPGAREALKARGRRRARPRRDRSRRCRTVQLTHSESTVFTPLGSGITMMGATPWWARAKASAVPSASPSLDQSDGAARLAGEEDERRQVGVALANQAGGR